MSFDRRKWTLSFYNLVVSRDADKPMQFYAILLLHFSHFEFRNLLKPFCSGHRQPVPLRQCLPLCLCIWPFYTFSRKSLKVLLCPHNSNAIALFHVNCCFPFVYPIFPSLSVVALTHLAQHISIRQRRRRLESESPDVTQGVEFTNKSVFQKCGHACILNNVRHACT